MASAAAPSVEGPSAAVAASGVVAAVRPAVEVRPLAGKTCPKCGHSATEAASFCNQCGEALIVNRPRSIGGILLTLLAALVLCGLVVGGCAYSGYNQAVRLDESVKNKWAQVDTVLQRRYDLIPNLVATVKGYAAHEEQIFTQIAESRTKYFQAGNQTEKVDAANGMERALSRLLVLTEKYPDLKAQTNFLALQDELAGTENRIAVERKRYNDAVTELNTYARSLLGRTFAGWAGVKPAEYFEVPEPARATPQVDFSKPK